MKDFKDRIPSLKFSIKNIQQALRRLNRGEIIFVALLIAFVGYGLLYIARDSFIVNGQRTFALFDDAMISMRYARNLAQGDGLVWNPGAERVEGYSNPLWVVYMAFFHLLPIPTHLISLTIQLSGLLFLLLNLVVVKNIAKELSSAWIVALLAVFLTAFYYPLNTWGLQGMEVSALTLLLSLAVWKCIQALKGKRFSYWPYVFLGVGTLLRIDAAVPYIIILAFCAYSQPKYRQQHLLWGLGLLAGFLGGQTLLRLWYYGDILPNTYYLKLGGIPLAARISQGLNVFLSFLWDSGWLLMSIPALLLVLWPTQSIILLAAVFLGQVAYSIYVGGDSWDHQGGANRFISIAIPLFFILFAQVLDKIRQHLLAGRRKSKGQAVSQIALAAFVFASLFSFNTLRVQNSASKLFLRENPIFAEGTQRGVEIALTLEKISTPQARIAVVGAGNIPYFHEAYYIDLLGKNDPYIAHLPPVEAEDYQDDFYDFRPGHAKWDLDYSINVLKPDIIAQLPGDPSRAEPYLGNYTKVTIDELPYYLLIDSPNIIWENIPQPEP